MANGNNNGLLVPAAADALNQLKFVVAQELGVSAGSPQEFREFIDRAKYEIAADIGVPLQHGYNGDLPSRDAGAVGGRLGGHLGGQMVKRMIAQAEKQLANRQH